MFDLKQSLADWRERMIQSRVYTKADMDELEDHLLESMAEWKKTGLSEEESFWIGTRRLGDAGRLEKEFQKINPGLIWRHRVFWMIAGLFGYWIISRISTLPSTLCVTWMISLGVHDAALLGWLTSALHALFILFWILFLYAACHWRWLNNHLNPILKNAGRKTLLFTTVLLAVFSASLCFLVRFVELGSITSILSPDDYGEYRLYLSISSYICLILPPLVLMAIAFKLHDRKKAYH